MVSRKMVELIMLYIMYAAPYKLYKTNKPGCVAEHAGSVEKSLKTLTSNRVITIVSFHLEFERRNGNTLFKGCFVFYS